MNYPESLESLRWEDMLQISSSNNNFQCCQGHKCRHCGEVAVSEADILKPRNMKVKLSAGPDIAMGNWGT